MGILGSESPSSNDSRKRRREMLQELFSFSWWEPDTGARFTWSGRRHLNWKVTGGDLGTQISCGLCLESSYVPVTSWCGDFLADAYDVDRRTFYLSASLATRNLVRLMWLSRGMFASVQSGFTRNHPNTSYLNGEALTAVIKASAWRLQCAMTGLHFTEPQQKGCVWFAILFFSP